MANRDAIREAIRDELATIRVLNQALRFPMSMLEQKRLSTARAVALAQLQRALAQLHPPATRRRKKSAQ
jgi:hypothetical protein